MTQEVRIGVNAKTDEAAANVRKVEAATDALGASTERVAKASRAAADGMRQMQAIGERLKNVQSTLSKELGKPVDAGDAAMFLMNFDRMKNGRGIGAQKTKGFGSFEDWYAGHSTMFKRQADAERHRRYVMAVGMQRTDYATQHGIPAFPGLGGAPAPSPGPSIVDQGMQRAGGMAMGFGKSMLAMAGLTTIAGMVGQSVDMATEKAVTTDTLKRRMGDLGVSFEALNAQVEDAARGMGMTTVEVAKLADQFAKTAGNVAADTIGAKVKSSIGFARAFGMDPGDASQFFGLMQKLGASGKDDQSNRRFALMIAEAIEKSGYTPMAADTMAAIANFATKAASMTLSNPDVASYSGLLTSLMGSKLPGLDPSGAAAILNSADTAVRAGGGMGQAGMNFTYAALMRGSRGITNPVEAEALWQGGLFGSTQNTFGEDSAIGQWAAKNGVAVPELSGDTSFGKIRGLMKRQYGSNPWYYLDAMKNYFGLSSISQAAALDNANITDLSGAGTLVGRAGMKLSDLSASGIQGVAAISSASSMADLEKIYQATMARSDVSDAEKGTLRDAEKSGDFGLLRDALVRIVGSHDQEITEGSQTRQTIADLKNELTKVGTLLLAPLNIIRDGIVKMAHLVEDNTTVGGPPKPAPWGGGKGGPGRSMIGQPALSGLVAPSGGGGATAAQRRAMAYFQSVGWTRAQAAGIVANLTAESGMDPTRVGDNGEAYGLAQFHPDRLAALKKFAAANKLDYTTESAQLAFVNYEMTQGNEKAAGNALRNTGTAKAAGDVVSRLYERPMDGFQGLYRGRAAEDLWNTPLPQSAGAVDRDRFDVHIAGEIRLPVVDGQGKPAGVAVLTPYVRGQVAGSGQRSVGHGGGM